MKLETVTLCLGVLLTAIKGDKMIAGSWRVEDPSSPNFMDALKSVLKHGNPPANPPAQPVHRIESVKTLHGMGILRYRMVYVTREVKYDLTRCTIEFRQIWGPRHGGLNDLLDHLIDHLSCDYIARIPF